MTRKTRKTKKKRNKGPWIPGKQTAKDTARTYIPGKKKGTTKKRKTRTKSKRPFLADDNKAFLGGNGTFLAKSGGPFLSDKTKKGPLMATKGKPYLGGDKQFMDNGQHGPFLSQQDHPLDPETIRAKGLAERAARRQRIQQKRAAKNGEKPLSKILQKEILTAQQAQRLRKAPTILLKKIKRTVKPSTQDKIQELQSKIQQEQTRQAEQAQLEALEDEYQELTEPQPEQVDIPRPTEPEQEEEYEDEEEYQ